MSAATATFQQQLAALGMSIRPEKCIAWSPRGLPAPLPLPPGCQTPPGGLTILGVPFGTPS
eukprot:SM012362S26033  [mRNA]  locus=s12362:192:371:- [translate_table: standard]